MTSAEVQRVNPFTADPVKAGGLDQYGAEPFEQQQFRTVGVKGVKRKALYGNSYPQSSLFLHVIRLSAELMDKNSGRTDERALVFDT